MKPIKQISITTCITGPALRLSRTCMSILLRQPKSVAPEIRQVTIVNVTDGKKLLVNMPERPFCAAHKKAPDTAAASRACFLDEIKVLGRQAMQMRCAAGEGGVVVFDH